jgi:hypothetical protein
VATVEPTADITVRLVDYAFDYSTPLTAGSHTLRVENGAQQPHEIALIRLSPGKTLGDLMAWAEAYAGSMPGEILGGVAAIGPGSTAYFSVDLTPGDYALLCFVPDAGDAKPHVMHGMAHQLTIS